MLQLLAFVPVATQVALMTWNVVNPMYCAPVVPMLFKLNAPVPVPPSCNTSVPAPTTLPLMTKPGPSVSVLTPDENSMAAVAPVMVPESKMLIEGVLCAQIPMVEAEIVPVLVIPPENVDTPGTGFVVMFVPPR
jgi:hypothetical protein